MNIRCGEPSNTIERPSRTYHVVSAPVALDVQRASWPIFKVTVWPGARLCGGPLLGLHRDQPRCPIAGNSDAAMAAAGPRPARATTEVTVNFELPELAGAFYRN